MSSSTNLKDEWARDMAALGAAADSAASIFEDINRHYGSAERHYHGLSHLKALFHLIDTYAPQPAGSAVRFAIWWHDVIYDPLSSQNEVASAQLARSQLGLLGAGEPLIETVCALIEATKNHFAAPSFGADDVFLDADIAILGAPDEIYWTYTQQIRLEYHQIPDPIFAAGRKRFLETATQWPRIFKTDIFEAEFGHQARTNLERELRLYQTS